MLCIPHNLFSLLEFADEGKGKRHRTVEDEDSKSRKSDNKDKKRSHKHSDKGITTKVLCFSSI